MDIDVPQDRESSFEPKVVQKHQKDISGIEDKIIAIIYYPKLG
jgi:putative transposase